MVLESALRLAGSPRVLDAVPAAVFRDDEFDAVAAWFDKCGCS